MFHKTRYILHFSYGTTSPVMEYAPIVMVTNAYYNVVYSTNFNHSEAQINSSEVRSK